MDNILRQADNSLLYNSEYSFPQPYSNETLHPFSRNHEYENHYSHMAGSNSSHHPNIQRRPVLNSFHQQSYTNFQPTRPYPTDVDENIVNEGEKEYFNMDKPNSSTNYGAHMSHRFVGQTPQSSNLNYNGPGDPESTSHEFGGQGPPHSGSSNFTDDAPTAYENVCHGFGGQGPPHPGDKDFISRFGCCYNCISKMQASKERSSYVCRGEFGELIPHMATKTSFERFGLCIECVPLPKAQVNTKAIQKRQAARYKADQLLLQNLLKCIEDVLLPNEIKHLFEVFTEDEKKSGERLYEKIKHSSMVRHETNWSKKNKEANSFANMMWDAYDTPCLIFAFHKKTGKIMSYGKVEKMIRKSHDVAVGEEGNSGAKKNPFLIAEKFIFTALREYERTDPIATMDQSLLAAKVLNAGKGIKQLKQVKTDKFRIDARFEATWGEKLEAMEIDDNDNEDPDDIIEVDEAMGQQDLEEILSSSEPTEVFEEELERNSNLEFEEEFEKNSNVDLNKNPKRSQKSRVSKLKTPNMLQPKASPIDMKRTGSPLPKMKKFKQSSPGLESFKSSSVESSKEALPVVKISDSSSRYVESSQSLSEMKKFKLKPGEESFKSSSVESSKEAFPVVKISNSSSHYVESSQSFSSPLPEMTKFKFTSSSVESFKSSSAESSKEALPVVKHSNSYSHNVESSQSFSSNVESFNLPSNNVKNSGVFLPEVISSKSSSHEFSITENSSDESINSDMKQAETASKKQFSPESIDENLESSQPKSRPDAGLKIDSAKIVVTRPATLTIIRNTPEMDSLEQTDIIELKGGNKTIKRKSMEDDMKKGKKSSVASDLDQVDGDKGEKTKRKRKVKLNQLIEKDQEDTDMEKIIKSDVVENNKDIRQKSFAGDTNGVKSATLGAEAAVRGQRFGGNRGRGAGEMLEYNTVEKNMASLRGGGNAAGTERGRDGSRGHGGWSRGRGGGNRGHGGGGEKITSDAVVKHLEITKGGSKEKKSRGRGGESRGRGGESRARGGESRARGGKSDAVLKHLPITKGGSKEKKSRGRGGESRAHVEETGDAVEAKRSDTVVKQLEITEGSSKEKKSRGKPPTLKNPEL